MTVLSTHANAKLNLCLDVLGKRFDGYHDLRMVMQEIDLHDVVKLTVGTGQGIRVFSGSDEIPLSGDNIAAKAASLFLDAAGLNNPGIDIDIEKHTPVCAGMGGGSADGAAVLKLLWDYYNRPVPEKVLYELAEKVGSDVPFALFGGTALAEGKGEKLKRISPMPQCKILVCKPDFPLSTPVLFRAIDDTEILSRPDCGGMVQAISDGNLSDIAIRLGNVFQTVASADHPEINEICETMLAGGALNACMTGSGPTVFGIINQDETAEGSYKLLKARYTQTYLVSPVTKTEVSL